MLIGMLALVIGGFLSYANGANDNFKGVATLYGSGSATFKQALIWSSLATVLGSVTALILANGLIATFSGKGLVPDSVLMMRTFAMAVGFGAALTVMLATYLGFPISTTHALTGALVGAGFFASSSGVNFAKLSSAFFIPLLVSPLLSMLMATLIYPLFRQLREKTGIKKETCVCIGKEVIGVVPIGTQREAALAMVASSTLTTFAVGTEATCVDRYQGQVLGVTAAGAIDTLHYLSAGAVCFARGLNDTPKIAAILLAGSAFSPNVAVILIAVAMLLGGLLNSKKVAETMAHKVTEMNHGQGFTANLITSLLVISASSSGLPVSTTHVSCGALFGIGTVTRQAHWKMIASILVAWVTTLPAAALISAFVFWALNQVL